MNLSIFFLATFPPPTTGWTLINQRVYERLDSQQFLLQKSDLIDFPNLPNFVSRILSVFFIWVDLFKFYVFARRKDINPLVYLAISGGLGQIYDILVLIIVRILNYPCIIHHHSSAYLNQYKLVSKLLFVLAGPQAGHVVLCREMKKRLSAQYKISLSQITVLSNLAFIPEYSGVRHERTKVQRIGYISNITIEKGGEEIIRLSRELHKRKFPVEIIVAGPARERELANALEQSHQQGLLRWLGPVYGNAKRKFWDDIDVFLFPTRYRNEAEPLVVWEAITSGIPVIAYDRGCIREQVGPAGKIILPAGDFVEKTIEILDEWLTRPDEYHKLVERTYSLRESKRTDSVRQWSDFVVMLTNISSGK